MDRCRLSFRFFFFYFAINIQNKVLLTLYFHLLCKCISMKQPGNKRNIHPRPAPHHTPAHSISLKYSVYSVYWEWTLVLVQYKTVIVIFMKRNLKENTRTDNNVASFFYCMPMGQASKSIKAPAEGLNI